MQRNLTRFLSAVTFALLGLVSFIIIMPTASAGEVDDYITKLKTHYKSTLSIKAYSMKYHFLNRRYQDHNYWDYQTPNLFMSQRVVEADLVKRHFYDNDIVYYSGGRLYDRAQFQNNKESFFYEKSATVLGKAVQRRDMDNFDIFKGYNVMNIDFLAVRPLLEETDIKGNITLHQERKSGATTLIHKTSNDDVIDYKFSNNPLQLISINHRPLGGIFVYNDYQTTKNMTFARSIYQYYDGETKPTYISFIDNFNIIEEVDPTRLQLPEGYGPIISRGDGVLVSKEIATDLYLITDSSAARNSLFKVNGDKITVFGASNNSRLADKTIKLILDQFPKKKIVSVYVTHPHGHQISGLKAFANQGIEILADNYSIAAIKAYPPFADDIATFKFRTIEHEHIIDDTHFYVLENMHSKRQGFVYFKDSGIIFQTHFLHIPQDNTIAKVIPSYTRTFIDFVRSKQLKINRIVANYNNNNISVEVMNKTYDVNF
ncbi:MBL fold metallo-hydrolase [Kordiimonas aquimaris]|uniref:hypothetical protein n=1 Tax=Kordiimonas aquimaris TaxID=707591 RepID=UPI0021D2DEE3|nr:hypothetical protein [Kordiimonas aquimaris]